MKSKIKTIANKPVDKLKELALGIKNGQVFTDRHIDNKRDFTMVFLVLGFLDAKAHKALVAQKPAMVYEWMSHALPRSCNGMPMFLSCGFLNKHDAEQVWKMVQALDEAEKKTLEAVK